MQISKQLAILTAIGTLLQGCATSSDLEPPEPPPQPVGYPPNYMPAAPVVPPMMVYRVELRSSSASAAYAMHETVLSGLSLNQRRNHLAAYGFSPLELPAHINASIGDEIWVVPRCNGVVRWEWAGVYTVGSNATITIRCQP